MSFLNELRQQADIVKTQQASQVKTARDIAADNERAMQTTLRYFNELTAQLNVIKPECDRKFPLDGTAVLENLRMDGFGVSSRRESLREESPWSFVQLRFKYVNERPLTIEKEPEQVKRFAGLLNDHGIKFEIANERERLVKPGQAAKFQIQQTFPAEILVSPTSGAAELSFLLRNIERFSAFKLQFDASAVSSELLDEMSKYMLGHTSQFRNLGRYLSAAR